MLSLSKRPGVGKTVVIIFAEYDMVKYADAEDFGGFNQAVRAVAVFPRGSGVSAWVDIGEPAEYFDFEVFSFQAPISGSAAHNEPANANIVRKSITLRMGGILLGDTDSKLLNPGAIACRRSSGLQWLYPRAEGI